MGFAGQLPTRQAFPPRQHWDFQRSGDHAIRAARMQQYLAAPVSGGANAGRRITYRSDQLEIGSMKCDAGTESALPNSVEDSLASKERRLRRTLRQFDRVLVAFSGGVDSSVLLAVAFEELGPGASAALAVGPSLPDHDRRDALDVARRLGVEVELVETAETSDERYLRNGPDRCFWCRSALADALRPRAEERGAVILYGPVADDLAEDRPGMDAAEQKGLRAPLLEAGLTKAEIRQLARRLGLPVWDKPASACLASRLPTGVRITAERLHRVDRAEAAVRTEGFKIVRVRDHGDLARLELGAEEIQRLADPDLRERVATAVRAAGFARVAVDLEGYRPSGLKARLPSR